jgi:hypothetical protein
LALILTVSVTQIATLAAPKPAAAVDGEILCAGTDIFTSVRVVTGAAQVNICNLDDCPAFLSNCFIEVRWRTKCEWVWCPTFDDRSGWIRLDGPDVARWCQKGKQQYKLDMRMSFIAPAVKQMEFRGQNETVVEIGGSIVYRLIAKFFFNVTNQTGTRLGILIATLTAASGTSASYTVATSGSGWITLSC